APGTGAAVLPRRPARPLREGRRPGRRRHPRPRGRRRPGPQAGGAPRRRCPRARPRPHHRARQRPRHRPARRRHRRPRPAPPPLRDAAQGHLPRGRGPPRGAPSRREGARPVRDGPRRARRPAAGRPPRRDRPEGGRGGPHRLPRRHLLPPRRRRLPRRGAPRPLERAPRRARPRPQRHRRDPHRDRRRGRAAHRGRGRRSQRLHRHRVHPPRPGRRDPRGLPPQPCPGRLGARRARRRGAPRHRGLHARGPHGRRPRAPPRPPAGRPRRRRRRRRRPHRSRPRAPLMNTTSPHQEPSVTRTATSPARSPPPPGTELLSEEHQRLAARVRDFADEVVAPASYTYDTERRLPMEILAEMGAMGLFGLPLPRTYDGQGRDYLSLCVAVEQLARVDQSIAVTLEAGLGLGAMPILTFGTAAQKERHLPALARGEQLTAFGLTEAEAGSDAGGTRTTARLEDGHWVIDGTKQFITNSGTPITSLVTITAVTGQRQGRDGRSAPELSSIIVPTDTPGFTVLPGYDKVGWHT